MSKLTDIIASSRTLAISAVEEASRFGARDVDLEHVFLALAISDRPAGHLLRDIGITLDDARDAVAEYHREQLATLGIDASLPGDGKIRFHEEGAYDYTERAMRVMSQSGGWQRAADSLEILRSLVTEPTGSIGALVARLGTSAAEIIAHIDRTERDDESDVRQRDSRATSPQPPLSRTHSAFVPAPLEAVRGLVSDADRLPEWEMNLVSVRPEGDAWTGQTRTVAPDGKRLKVADRHRRQHVELVESADARVVWHARMIDDPRANARVIEVDLEPVTNGTRVTVRFSWQRTSPARAWIRPFAAVARVLLRPVRRVVLWVQVTALTDAISRALR